MDVWVPDDAMKHVLFMDSLNEGGLSQTHSSIPIVCLLPLSVRAKVRNARLVVTLLSVGAEVNVFNVIFFSF